MNSLFNVRKCPTVYRGDFSLEGEGDREKGGGGKGESKEVGGFPHAAYLRFAD